VSGRRGVIDVVPTPSAYRLVRTVVEASAAPVLDPSQRAVVAHPGGPLLVLAGPGTGKTTTLVEAVVDRVERGARPDEILVLTFSRKAADELRERIATRVGRTVAEPAAYTFHSWCFALVRAHAGPGRLPRLLSQPERDVRIRELLAGHAEGAGTVRWPGELRPALLTRGFAREVAALFDRARERGLDGASLRTLGEQAGRVAWTAAGTFLDEYLDVLDARGEVDYAGLVAAATDLLARVEVAASVGERYRAVFVDEYQDTDPSQERLLQALAGGGRDLVVVGDPDQSVYAFRGADVGNILGFPDRFRTASGAPAPVVTLSVSRRAGAALLAATRKVAERITAPGLAVDALRAHRALDPQGPAGDPPQVRLFPSTSEQVAAIADLVRRAHLQDGVPWDEIAVLVRSGLRSLPVLRRSLVAAGVPVSVAADDVPVARDPAVAPLLIGLRVADAGFDALSPDDARLLLMSPLGRARPSTLRALGRRLRALERAGGAAVPTASAVLLRDAVADPRDLTTVEEWMAAPVRRLHDLITKAREVLHGAGTPEEALWVLWNDSGWARRLAAEAAGDGASARNADRDLDAVVALFDAAARLEEREPRAGVATLLDELGMQEIPAAPQEERVATSGAVRLLTAHRSKGLEWDVVVVADVQEDVWPDLRRRGSLLEVDEVDTDDVRPAPTAQQLLVDERRLFYVALTRARRRCVVTAVNAVDEAGARPSRFLDELVDELPATQLAGVELLSPASLVARLRRAVQDDSEPDELRRAAAARLARLASAVADDGTPLVPVADPASWWGIRDWTPGVRPARDPEKPLRLSASAVASYDACPLRWFLEREVNAGGAATVAQGFGTVVHALAKLVADGTLAPDADALVQRLDDVWSALGFEAAWQADREREEARKALHRLVRWLGARDRDGVASEAEFEVALSLSGGGDVVLRGAVDRLEIDADGKVRVVDFKTGRSAKGKATVAADPQLGVYQIAVREGAFESHLPQGAEVGGAELVYLRTEYANGLPIVREQPSLPEESPTWADQLLDRTATGIRAETFCARVNDGCGSCAFQAVCPAQDAGEQVVR
jgi:superfamily I DNA/RNA helicase/RecB family exonuclease